MRPKFDLVVVARLDFRAEFSPPALIRGTIRAYEHEISLVASVAVLDPGRLRPHYNAYPPTDGNRAAIAGGPGRNRNRYGTVDGHPAGGDTDCDQHPDGDTDPIIYTVESGDTLLGIANQFNISTERLQEANGIIDPRLLQIGQTLVIPPPDRDPQAAPSPSATPYPVEITAINLQQTRQGKLWALGSVKNPGDDPVAEVVVEISLFDANGVLLVREAAFTQLDVVLPGQSAPFAVLFESAPETFAQYQVVPVSAVLLAGDTRYYFDLEPIDLRGAPVGIDTYRISGQLRNTGTEDVEAIRLVAITFDQDDRVLAQRQADLAVNLLRAGATTPFELDMIIPGGKVDQFTVLAQGLRAD